MTRAATYSRHGGPDVLEIVHRARREPGPGEVGVAVAVSAVNPIDLKSRLGTSRAAPTSEEVVPHHDGAGVVDSVGADVHAFAVGDRVWIREANWGRAEGTAQERVVLPEGLLAHLPDDVSFEDGAALGVPALTAHRCLTVARDGPRCLGPGALVGRSVLVVGGAGAVGNAAIRLARWSGARVLATVSGTRKAALAEEAGAHCVVMYRSEDVAQRVRDAAPEGVDLVLDLAPAVNLPVDLSVLRAHGTVVVYGSEGGSQVSVPLIAAMHTNVQLQFVVVFKAPDGEKQAAVADVGAALRQGVFRSDTSGGLPGRSFPLVDIRAAHVYAESGVLGRTFVLPR